MITRTPNGFIIALHVQPRAKRTEIAGTHGEAFKLRVAAPPVDNAANNACIAFFAKQLGVPKGRIEILTGHTSRSKRIQIACTPADGDGRRLKSTLNAMFPKTDQAP